MMHQHLWSYDRLGHGYKAGLRMQVDKDRIWPKIALGMVLGALCPHLGLEDQRAPRMWPSLRQQCSKLGWRHSCCLVH